MKEEKIKLGKLEIDLYGLAEFLVQAKKESYAGNGKEKKLKDGSRQLVFQNGNFHYTDTYSGYYQFVGNEIVRYQNEKGQMVWGMNYIGGMPKEFKGIEELPIDKELTKKTYDFLRKALLQVTPGAPFRGFIDKEKTRLMAGPDYGFYKNNKKNLIYTNKVFGSIEWFRGRESISTIKPNKEVYSLIYHGGIIIPK